ncbi:Vir protein, partial [Legionella feeleii]
IKRKISYQSLREKLYVAPIKGVKTGCPSHQQMKRAIKSLAREGIIEIRSTAKNLIVKCLLADPHPVLENETGEEQHRTSKTQNIVPSKATYEIPYQTPIPSDTTCHDEHLQKKFEEFWQSYPLPSYKSHAWEQFKKINPDNASFKRLILSLQKQINDPQQFKYDKKNSNWPYPSVWLEQRYWE